MILETIYCPWCRKADINDHHDNAFSTMRDYGANMHQFQFQCTNCDKMYLVQMWQTIKISKSEKADDDEITSFTQ